MHLYLCCCCMFFSVFRRVKNLTHFLACWLAPSGLNEWLVCVLIHTTSSVWNVDNGEVIFDKFKWLKCLWQQQRLRLRWSQYLLGRANGKEKSESEYWTLWEIDWLAPSFVIIVSHRSEGKTFWISIISQSITCTWHSFRMQEEEEDGKTAT